MSNIQPDWHAGRKCSQRTLHRKCVVVFQVRANRFVSECNVDSYLTCSPEMWI